MQRQGGEAEGRLGLGEAGWLAQGGPGRRRMTLETRTINLAAVGCGPSPATFLDRIQKNYISGHLPTQKSTLRETL